MSHNQEVMGRYDLAEGKRPHRPRDARTKALSCVNTLIFLRQQINLIKASNCEVGCLPASAYVMLPVSG